jgi:hypothetical protein
MPRIYEKKRLDSNFADFIRVTRKKNTFFPSISGLVVDLMNYLNDLRYYSCTFLFYICTEC